MEQMKYPYTIDNGHGEQMTFTRLVNDPTGDWLEGENVVQPNAGAPMHVHHVQEEGFTILKGTIGVEILGQPVQYYGEGASIVFKAGEAHRFWNAGTVPLHYKGYVKPAYNFEYFITGVFYSTASNSKPEPQKFEAAWLLTHFRTEFDMLIIPSFVKKFIFPIIVFLGKLQGKDKKFKDAPKAFTAR
jgi:quercetin dioxygenase-like cupin family protein